MMVVHQPTSFSRSFYVLRCARALRCEGRIVLPNPEAGRVGPYVCVVMVGNVQAAGGGIVTEVVVLIVRRRWKRSREHEEG